MHHAGDSGAGDTEDNDFTSLDDFADGDDDDGGGDNDDSGDG